MWGQLRRQANRAVKPTHMAIPKFGLLHHGLLGAAGFAFGRLV
jgi:hypothetical protein